MKHTVMTEAKVILLVPIEVEVADFDAAEAEATRILMEQVQNIKGLTKADVRAREIHVQSTTVRKRWGTKAGGRKVKETADAVAAD